MTIKCKKCSKVIDPMQIRQGDCQALMCTHQNDDGGECKQFMCGFCFEFADTNESTHHHLHVCPHNPQCMSNADQIHNFGVTAAAAAASPCPCCLRPGVAGDMYAPNHIFQRLFQIYKARSRVSTYWTTVLPPSDNASAISQLLYTAAKGDLLEGAGLVADEWDAVVHPAAVTAEQQSSPLAAVECDSGSDDTAALMKRLARFLATQETIPMVNLRNAERSLMFTIAGNNATFPTLFMPGTDFHPILARDLLDFLTGAFANAFVTVHTSDIVDERLRADRVRFWQRVTVPALTAEEELVFPTSTTWMDILASEHKGGQMTYRNRPIQYWCTRPKKSEYMRNGGCNLYIALGATIAAFILNSTGPADFQNGQRPLLSRCVCLTTTTNAYKRLPRTPATLPATLHAKAICIS